MVVAKASFDVIFLDSHRLTKAVSIMFHHACSVGSRSQINKVIQRNHGRKGAALIVYKEASL